MWAIVLIPLALIVFGFVSACAVWGITRFAPAWLLPFAERIKKYPAIWGYIVVFGLLATFMLAASILKS